MSAVPKKQAPVYRCCKCGKPGHFGKRVAGALTAQLWWCGEHAPAEFFPNGRKVATNDDAGPRV